MKKKNTLISLLAIPIISLAPGCRMPYQINSPYKKPIKIQIIENGKEKTISSYYRRFAEVHTSSQVIEIKGKEIKTKKYIGTGIIDLPEVDRFNGKPIHFYSPEEQIKINKDYVHYLELAQSYQQERKREIRKQIRKKFQEEAERRVEQELRNQKNKGALLLKRGSLLQPLVFRMFQN